MTVIVGQRCFIGDSRALTHGTWHLSLIQWFAMKSSDSTHSSRQDSLTYLPRQMYVQQAVIGYWRNVQFFNVCDQKNTFRGWYTQKVHDTRWLWVCVRVTHRLRSRYERHETVVHSLIAAIAIHGERNGCFQRDQCKPSIFDISWSRPFSVWSLALQSICRQATQHYKSEYFKLAAIDKSCARRCLSGMLLCEAVTSSDSRFRLGISREGSQCQSSEQKHIQFLWPILDCYI